MDSSIQITDSIYAILSNNDVFESIRSMGISKPETEKVDRKELILLLDKLSSALREID